MSINVGSEEQINGNFNLLPVQLPIYPNGEDPPEFEEPDLSIYNSITSFPANFALSYTTNGFRDYNYASIEFSPVRYVPRSQQLYLITSLTITIDYTINTGLQEHKRRPYNQTDKLAYENLKSIVINPSLIDAYYPQAAAKLVNYQSNIANCQNNTSFLPTELPALEGSPVEYVIITNNTDVYGNYMGDFLAMFEQLAHWKTLSGSSAKVISVDDIRQNYPGVDIAEQIREFIKKAHEYWGTEYVLLGGNASIVPERWIGTPNFSSYQATDLYYSAIWHPYLGYADNWNKDGDQYFGRNSYDNGDYADFTPDIAVGRAPMDTEAEVDLFLSKNFTYERCSFAENVPDDTWLNKQLNIGGIVFNDDWPIEGPGTNGLGLPTFWYIEEQFSDDSEQYTMLEYFDNWEVEHADWAPAYNVMDEIVEHDAVVNRINAKPGIIFHLDHSSPNGLGLASVTETTTGLRANDFNELTIDNRYPILFGGGCHTVALERDSYIGEQWLCAQGGGILYLGASKDIGAIFGYSYYQNLFDKLYHTNIYTAGLLKNISTVIEDKTEYLQKIMNLLGDPELSIYTDEAVDMNLSYNSSIPLGNSDFAVNVSNFPANEEVKITLFKENEVFATTSTTTGNVNFNITPDTPGQMKITATCHNAEPYEGIVNITQNSGVHLYYSDIIVNDANANGYIEPGENIIIDIQLRNSGSSNASGISAVLVAGNNGITVSQNTSTYPDISTDQIAINNNDYVFVVYTNNTTYGTVLPFEFQIITDQGTFIENFDLNIQTYNLEVGNRTLTVNGIETNTNVFNPGDELELLIDASNFSNIIANNVTALLDCEMMANKVSITDGIETYGNILGFETITNSNPFTISIGSAYNHEDIVLQLELMDNLGKTDIFEINLTEAPLDSITNFEFTSLKNEITISWDWEGAEDIQGFNIYRSNTENGTFSKVKQFKLTGTPMYLDVDVEMLEDYFYKISAISSTGNELSMDELTTYRAWTSLDYYDSWNPVDVPAQHRFWGAPNVYDIDNDGDKEIFINSGRGKDAENIGAIFGFYNNGQELYDIDGNETTISGFADIGISMTSTPAIGDIDNDGIAEVVVATRMGNPGNDPIKYKLLVYKNQDLNQDFKPDLMWEKQIKYKNFNGVVLSDLNGDNKLEIIVPNQKGEFLEIFDCYGIYYNNGPISTGEIASDNQSVSMPVAVDLDDIGNKEVVIGLEGGIYIYNDDGTDFNTNPVYTDAGRMDCPVIVADIDNDDEFEILFMSIKNLTGYIYAIETDGSYVSGWSTDDHSIELSVSSNSLELSPSFTCGDINLDGNLEVLIADKGKLIVWNHTGSLHKEIIISDNFQSQCLQPLVADIDDSNEGCEIVVTSNHGIIYAYDYNLEPVMGWPLYINEVTASIPLIADIDGNGKNEIIAANDKSNIFIWETPGNAAMVDWGRFRLNSHNNAVYDRSCSYNPVPLELSGNISWNTERVIESDVIINSGTLTINADVKLASLSKIIVKPGAQLIVNNAKLSNNCSQKWQGIQVWGQKDQPQESQYQGKVVLQNAIIENAHEAVSLWKSGDYLSSGGMITATNTTFKNNRRSVCFMSYKNIHPVFGIESNYAASFRQCEFIADNDYILDNPFHTFLSMWEVRGVQVKGCKFINNAAFDGHALYTLNAGYRLDGFCDGATGPDGCLPQHWDKNEFLGFEKAIESSNSNQLQYAINIESSLFDANDYGIYFTGITNGATVLFNEFYVGFDGNSFEKGICNYASGRGIQLNECFNFTVEENKFFESQSNPSGNDVVGVLVNNCASEYEEIYKNEFTGLTVGNQAEGVNQLWKSKEVNFGLTYNCNENQNNTIDFYVAPDASIRSLIGSANKPPGNTFSSTNPQFKNDGLTNIAYYYNMNVADEVLTYVSNGGSGSITAIPISSTNLCPSNYGTGGGTPIESKMVLTDTEVSQQEEVFYTNHQDFEAVSSLLNQLKDGGSTETTSLTIAAALPQDTWELRANLLGMSPYLSEDILKEASDRTDVLPESVLFEILSANPDELRNKNLMDHLENKEQPLPDYMINVLKQMSTGLSAKTALVSQQSMHADLKDKAAQAIVKSIINKEEYNVVELRNWLGNLQKLESDKQIVGTYLYEEDYTSATSLLNMIPSLYELEGDDLQSFNDFKGLMNIQIGLGQQGKNIFNLSNADKAQLSDYANYSTGSAKYGAQSILSFVYGDEFCDCVSPVGKSDKGTESFSYTENDIASAIGLSVVVKPNPANVYASFDYELPIGYEKANISIINTEGKVVYQDKLTGSIGQLTLDVSNYKSGAYLYKIQVGKYTYTETLIVQ